MKPYPKLLHNIAALSSVQVLGYILPLITLPYVTRVLGVEIWGKVAFIQVTLGYFNLLTNWGFSLSATRKVAKNRDNITKISSIFMATWVAQWLLCIIAIIGLSILILFVPFFMRSSLFYLYGIAGIVSSVLFPVWFLNGLEKMKRVAAMQIVTRLLAVPLIFIFVRSPEDAPILIAISGGTGILSGLLTVFWIKKNLGLYWKMPCFSSIFQELKSGGKLFLSTVWIGFYTTLTPIILGIVAGPSAVAYYILADKARLIAQSALAPISQALFPRMNHLFDTDVNKAINLLLRSSKIILSLSALFSCSLFFLADYIIVILAGEDFKPAVMVLKILSPLPLIISLSNIFGIQILLPNGKTKIFNIILGIVGGLSLCSVIPMIYWKGVQGAALNTLVIEGVVSVIMAVYLWKTGFLNKTYWEKK